MEAPLCRNLVRIQTGNGEHGFRRLFSRAVKGCRFKIECVIASWVRIPQQPHIKKKNTNSNLYSETIKSQSQLAQSVEHRSYEPKVVGSSPILRIFFFLFYYINQKYYS